MYVLYMCTYLKQISASKLSKFSTQPTPTTLKLLTNLLKELEGFRIRNPSIYNIKKKFGWIL